MGAPEGFRHVLVELTEAEYQNLCGNRWMTAAGTASAALRQSIGLSERPYGIVKAEADG